MVAPISDKILMLDAQAYFDHAGNKSDAARSRGLKRQTYSDRLTACEERLGMNFGKVAGGRLKEVEYDSRDLPKKGSVAYYLVTSIQNNTHIHPGFNNMLAYRDFLEGEILVKF